MVSSPTAPKPSSAFVLAQRKQQAAGAAPVKAEAVSNDARYTDDRVRPGACCCVGLSAYCTLPDFCSIAGAACCGLFCPGWAIGFKSCCTPCCSNGPILEELVKSLPRPPTYFLAPGMTAGGGEVYAHVKLEEYASKIGKDTYDFVAKDPPAIQTAVRPYDGGGMGSEEYPWLGQVCMSI